MTEETPVIEQTTIKKEKQSRGAIFIASIMTLAIVICGVAFFFKLYKFGSTLFENGSDMLGFAVLPVSNYLFIAAGFLMLLVWAYLRGEFEDIEGPKYELLKDHERYEAEERLLRQQQKG